jgi:hypothetical protein
MAETDCEEQVAAEAVSAKGEETTETLPGLITVTVANAGTPAVRLHRKEKQKTFFMTSLVKIRVRPDRRPYVEVFVELHCSARQRGSRINSVSGLS